MNRKPADSLGLRCPITRRDFVNGVLAGSGAALVSGGAGLTNAATRGPHPYSPSGSAWTGYGGIGDYRWSNGNTEAVRDAAHGIRDRQYPVLEPGSAVESHDLVIVGGGFSGLSVAYEFHKQRKPGQTCLLLENHPVLGGEAKQNDFEVDGVHLTAPQGSNAGLIPDKDYQAGGGRYQVYVDYYHELGLPLEYPLEPLAGGAQKYRLPTEHFDPMIVEAPYEVGYYFPRTGWARNPIASQFRNTPWPQPVQRQLDDFVNNRRDVVSGRPDADRWLDSITYYELLDQLGYGSEVRSYIDPLLCVGNFGVCGNAVSALAAKRLTLPGTIPSSAQSRFVDINVVSFPGGNSGIYRRMLLAILPQALTGATPLQAALQGRFNSAALDAENAPIRFRTGATVVHVRHEGPAESAPSVLLQYVKDGKTRFVRAKAVVMASGGWVNRNVVGDLPEAHRAAYAQFHYGPVLTANVAVRNWRFFDRLGFPIARWFSGFGWHVCVRRNVTLDRNPRRLTPDSPVVLTFYIPFMNPTVSPEMQGPAARAQLLGASYADLERRLREQMTEMFASGGFDARRDIAAIVLNRWGHAYMAPMPGFFHGTAGALPPPEQIRLPHGRIVFAHSELQGNMNMAHAMLEGKRGAGQALELLT
ncbi:MAG TPA: NAD(P)-binding protein [Steroidobacteraceae bacterium]|nr:NAD(P)-binding protein [Steroidobacteraceae bacterium]